MITSDMENMGISPLSSNTAADSRYSGDTVYTVDGVCFAMKPIAAVTNGCIGHRHDGDNKPHTVNLTSYIHFTVKTDAVKAMLKKNIAIRDEQITVVPSKS